MVAVESTGERRLGPLLPHDVILFRSQLGTPLGIRFLNLVQLGDLLFFHHLAPDCFHSSRPAKKRGPSGVRLLQSQPGRPWAIWPLRPWTGPALPTHPLPDT